MLDFFTISTSIKKGGVVEIYPKFIITNSKDLMIRGGDFYAVWIDELGLWSTNEQDLINMIDRELDEFAKKKAANNTDDIIVVKHMWDSSSGVIDAWHRYCQKQMRDNYKPLDEKIIFSNQATTKKDYASKKLPYALEEGPIDAYNELMDVLYSPEERLKLEWAIGSIVTGDSKKLQKFLVLYGAPGTGKGTILKIIESMFCEYCSIFDAESLGSSTDSFALEQFKANPLVAISYDSDLSHIEKNTRINSLVSHERMTVNEKHKAIYTMKFNSFLMLGTNKPVKITDAKSGIIRRLIDVYPTGKKIPLSKYDKLMKQIVFELGHIAYYCANVYMENSDIYNDYRPTLMMGESNDFYNFILDSYTIFKEEDGVSLKVAWEMYKNYCEEAKVPYPFAMRVFKSELKNYFENYEERARINDDYVRSYYSGFKTDIFETDYTPKETKKEKVVNDIPNFLTFVEQKSNLDILCSDCPAQYANEKEAPISKWINVKTQLKDIDTSQIHYLKVPENHIVIDFDIRDEDGNKSFEKNLEAASKWPKTYAEVSKSGGGIHLHYIYTGDVTQLSRVYADNIEIKIFTGNSSLRRKLTKCNNEKINNIGSGLPVKGEGKVINFDVIKNEKALRTIITKNLNKEYHAATKPSIDFIFKVLEDAYNSGMKYDVRDMYNIIFAFAASSTNQSDYCMKLVPKMKFKSEDPSEFVADDSKPIVFYDVEVFPNLFLVNYKMLDRPGVARLINPKPAEIEKMLKYRLVGFNNRRYDNHMLYGCMIGYNNEQLYKMSQQIIGGNRNAFFAEAYNLSYTDIYDYSSKKQSLKKWEIELGIHHQELGLPWDRPVAPELWAKVAEYCDNDVISTEAVWKATADDFVAREILADIADMSVNDTTNSLTTKIIFGNEKHPVLNYVDLSKEFPGYEFVKAWNPVTQTYDKANMYRGVDLGFGGYVHAEPGMYGNAGLLDIASMHPHSIIAMNLFGEYTINFKNLVDARIDIKHGEYDNLKTMFNGKLQKYLIDISGAKKLSKALKIPINAVYGLTAANFDTPFRDKRNENNIVALRGALFMKTLQDEVVTRGFKVAHIKTDSIKIPDATPDIIDFCMSFAKKYGYTFEHEATYDRMCLVNNAVYIAKYKSADECKEMYGYCPDENEKHGNEWTATGTQFQIPYVYKKCFTKEPIEFKDLCEAKEVKTAMYLDFNEDGFATDDGAKFVGKVGLFCPIKEGCGGGTLLAERKKKDGSTGLDAVVGTKGYHWLESEEVEAKGLQDVIDITYYDGLVNGAIDEINKYCDYEWFISDDPYVSPGIIDGHPDYSTQFD